MSLASRSHSFQLLREPRGKVILGFLVAAAVIVVSWLFLAVSKTFVPSTSQLLRAAATLVSVPIILFWFHNREKLTDRTRKLFWLLVLGIVVVFAAGSVVAIAINVIEPPEWDYLTFWLDGQVAIRGLNFYEPASYHSVALPISPGPAFAPEILDVGFRYPPPTMLLFMPLGLLEFSTGIAVWYAAQVTVMLLCVVLIKKTFLENAGIAGLVFAAALVVVVAGTFSTFQFAQTTFLALLMVLLFWRDRDRLRGGVWLTIGALVKPFLLILLIIPILRKNRRVLLGALLALTVISILTIVVVGMETFTAYFTDNPASRAADFIYTETTNPSLLATILRLSESSIDDRSMLTDPLYIGIAVALTAVTAWLLYVLEEDSLVWGFGLTLVLALMIYPASQIFYSTLLVVPLTVIWRSRNELPTGVWGSGALITGVLVLLAIGGYVFIANVLLWIALLAISTRVLLRWKFTSIDEQRMGQRSELPERTISRAQESIQ